MNNRINVRIDSNESENPKENVKIEFGPHYFVDIMKDKSGAKFVLGATHHGIMLDASTVGGELERAIGQLRENNPEMTVD
jgi:hypothetical protein